MGDEGKFLFSRFGKKTVRKGFATSPDINFRSYYIVLCQKDYPIVFFAVFICSKFRLLRKEFPSSA